MPKPRKFLLLITCLFACSLLGMRPRLPAIESSKSSAGSAYDLIAAVNQVRSSNGLPAYQVNGSLMASAQAHSEYQASISSITHTGRGGSDVKSRAIAAGYGGGAAVSVIENIYGGTNATPQQAVSNWQGDSLHLNTLLSSRAVDVGAGAATDGNLVYYTLDVGYIVGSEGSGSSSSSSSTTASSSVSPATTIAFYPVQVSTPNIDGSIIHVVQAGQTLWSIAATYKIDLPELQSLNNFTNNTFIYPGQKITIKSPDELPTSTPFKSENSPESTATREPMDTFVSKSTSLMIVTETEKDKSLSEPDKPASTQVLPNKKTAQSWTDPLLWLIAVFVVGGVVLMVVGSMLQQRK